MGLKQGCFDECFHAEIETEVRSQAQAKLRPWPTLHAVAFVERTLIWVQLYHGTDISLFLSLGINVPLHVFDVQYTSLASAR